MAQLLILYRFGGSLPAFRWECEYRTTRLPADDADIGVGLGGAKINESGNNDCDLLGRRLGNHALPVVARGGAEAGQFVPVEQRQRCARIQRNSAGATRGAEPAGKFKGPDVKTDDDSGGRAIGVTDCRGCAGGRAGRGSWGSPERKIIALCRFPE